MAFRTTQVHMGQGDHSIDFNADDPDAKLLGFGSTLVLFQGERPIWGGVVTVPADRSSDKITVLGRGLEWYLGDDRSGPLIEDREYVSGVNKLSNPRFDFRNELEPSDDTALFWTTGEGTAWYFDFPSAARTAGLPTEDDVMESTEEWEARPGYQYRQALAVTRNSGPATIGRLRHRLVFLGKYKPVELAVGYGQWTGSTHGDIALVDNDPLGLIPDGCLKIHTDHRELILNNTFNDGLVGWLQEQPNWGTVAAPDGNCLRTAGGGPALKAIHAENPDLPSGLNNFFPVVEGEEYFMDAWVSQEPGTNGEGVVTAYLGTGESDPTGVWLDLTFQRGSGDLRWVYETDTFIIPEDRAHLRPTVFAFNHTTGAWLFDNIHLWRTRGNTDTVNALSGFAIQTGRRYTAKVQFRSDPKISGTVQMRATCTGPGRTPLVLQGATLQATDGEVQEATWDIVAPSGYDFAKPQIFSQDVYGGSYWVGEWTIRDADATTVYSDLVTGTAHGTTTPEQNVTAPVGTKKVKVQVVAEADAQGWIVHEVGFNRIISPAATGEAIVAELLEDNGDPLVLAGTIHPAGTITADWQIYNLHNRQALKHLSRSGLVLPYREWRTYMQAVDGVPLPHLDWGLPEELFEVRPIVFTGTDVVEIGKPEVSSSAEEAVTDLKLIGATIGEAQITGRVTRALAGARTWFDTLLRRFKLVEDSSLTWAPLADLAAGYHMDLSQGSTSVKVDVGGPRALGEVNEGDWVHVYKPENGLTDDVNEMTLNGRPINPARLRVVSITREHAKGEHRLELHRHGEDPVVLNPIWSDKTTATFELGDPPAEFAGGSSIAFTRWWVSRPPTS